MANRLGWTLVPMLALAVVSVAAADDPATTKAVTASSSPSGKQAPGVPGPAVEGGSRAAGAASASKTGTIVCSAWNADNTPIPGANLRLRNVETGKVAAVAKTDQAGRFTFENVDGGTYLVELVTDSGRVETVSHVVQVAPGQTVATFVRLGSKTPWSALFFQNTAASVAATAATEGIAAIIPMALCQSPPCH